LLLGAASAALSACSGSGFFSPPPAYASDARVEAILKDAITIDMHSHAGRVLATRSGDFERPFVPLREPMLRGGMNVVCLAVVADTPVTHINPDHTISASRDPQPGELYAWSQKSFPRAQELIAREKLVLVTDRASMRRAHESPPAIIMACEGADFLEGRIERVDEFYERFSLRHMQLTHYRPNELGDIQTVAPVYNGLTDFGVEVVRRCNALGIVVDIAHAPYHLVKRAAEVTTKPLILSHTSLSPAPGARSRLISPDHARLVASTGGVIGVWPPASRFPSLDALARGIAAMADVAGVDHVGLGTDMLGLTGPAIFDSYTDLPGLVHALLEQGFAADDVRKVIGGNYARVYNTTVTA
jgi:membrane dipeptidase